MVPSPRRHGIEKPLGLTRAVRVCLERERIEVDYRKLHQWPLATQRDVPGQTDLRVGKPKESGPAMSTHC